jgi:hypothetical protein
MSRNRHLVLISPGMCAYSILLKNLGPQASSNRQQEVGRYSKALLSLDANRRHVDHGAQAHSMTALVVYSAWQMQMLEHLG